MSDGEDVPTESEPADNPIDAGEDETAAEDDQSSGESVDSAENAITASPEELEEQLKDAEDSVESADTEADLDAIETTLDAIETGIETLAEAEEDTDVKADDDESASEEEHLPVETLRSRLEAIRELVTEARGPYDTDVAELIESVAGTIEETRWTGVGITEIENTVETFASTVHNLTDTTVEITGENPDELAATVELAADAVTRAGFDPDEHSDTITQLLDAGETLETAVENAEEWSDLETNEQLRAEGFYDVLGHYKDFPPEWAALKRHERDDNPEMVLLALNSLQSEFMESHCIDTFQRMGRRAATEDVLDELLGRAQKRDEPSIEALGKMQAEEAIEPLIEYIDDDSNPQLQKVTFRALGEIGAQEAVAPLAQKLTLDNEHVRPIAARALGMIGDTRAILPLTETLVNDKSQDVRSAAAWALRQIGTRAALEAAAEQIDAEEFTVRHEAKLAAEALDAPAQSA